MEKILFFILSCASFLGGLDLEAQQMRMISKGDLDGILITRNEKFKGESLWGYIDGGADVYMEYGFNAVFVEELTWNNEHFLIDLYQMSSPEAAFGIYSISAFRCTVRDTLTHPDCFSRFQYQAASGELYLSVVNKSGSAIAKRKSLEIAAILLKKNRQEPFQPPVIPGLDLFRNAIQSVYFTRGILGRQNSIDPWPDFFEGVQADLYLYTIKRGEEEGLVGLIRFKTAGEKGQFIRSAGFTEENKTMSFSDGTGRNYHLFSETAIILLESRSAGLLNELSAAIDR